jgi:enamine deaminase RidA (YjgF/YER057c/UK114 family)
MVFAPADSELGRCSNRCGVGSTKAIEKINPAGLHEPEGYTQVVVAQETKRVYIAGQIGVDTDHVVVGPDLASQTAKAFENLGIALEAAGASWEHVVKWTGYFVGLDEAKLGEFFAGIGQAAERGLVSTAATLIGVQALYLPELLVEIEAIAEV